MELKDKIVLVTGSSDGIGRETAIEAAKRGAKVVVTYNSNKKAGEEVYNECSKIKDALLVQLDVTDKDSIKKCVENVVDKFGAIDVLINNAGVAVWKHFVEQTREEIDKQIDVNLIGLIKMTKACMPYFKGQDEGIIVNISSGAGKQGHATLSIYCATKFGVRGFTQALSKELNNIRVYSVNPGMTATAMTGYRGDDPKEVAKIIIDTAEEKMGKDSGDDVDIWEYI